jgi:hypothetical protein
VRGGDGVRGHGMMGECVRLEAEMARLLLLGPMTLCMDSRGAFWGTRWQQQQRAYGGAPRGADHGCSLHLSLLSFCT